MMFVNDGVSYDNGIYIHVVIIDQVVIVNK